MAATKILDEMFYGDEKDNVDNRYGDLTTEYTECTEKGRREEEFNQR